MKFRPCKITVVQKGLHKNVIDNYVKEPERIKICDVVSEKQEFIVTNPYHMPENMCASAWADIRPYIITMATGGTFDFLKNPKSTLAICSDPFRPVVFSIEQCQEKMQIQEKSE